MFLTGLHLPICCQLRLHEKLETLQQAIADSINVDYALNFDTGFEDMQDVNVAQHKASTQDLSATHKLQELLDQIIKH